MEPHRTHSRRDIPVRESLRLLTTIGFGRVAFTRRALPALRPVAHDVAGDHLVLAADPATARTLDGQVVVYEADIIDPHTQSGWCVVCTGTAEAIGHPDEVAVCQHLFPPGIDLPDDRLIRLSLDITTGIEYVQPE
ncbi:pyridoxamine 5'-phosphate oxidase family protein [Nocardia uniformis]|uniref:Pyridoxamine 5'-phosphate oxidase family protein n=1 Tax=Nocardia uniformis TaxID=53432 RepID=A0A849BXT2_9NOCA|nr:pyridoxamine 5'-phosphate oxidase family protein [Nocardia uniformis]NNH68487.1 pyridoxamine 5'-phosphate oxidase family protein [Nocardia uniformis]